MQPDRSVYFDDFARKQSSPTRGSKQQPLPQQTGPTNISVSNKGGACEWDRLMQEREELLQTGTYTAEDPLIKEIERQIQASQMTAAR